MDINKLDNTIKNEHKLSRRATRWYKYSIKKSVMTRNEIIFYHKLLRIFKGKYQIVPQMNLNTFLDFSDNFSKKKAKWAIDRYSVDYLICEYNTYQPIAAIELDDSSHNLPERILRDKNIDELFEETNMPIVHIRNPQKLSDTAIISQLTDAINGIQK